MSIKIENLTYVYSKKSPFEKVALSNVNLEIKDGEFFGIIGHTGSGKSTLISHLNALTKIQSGSITVGDIDLTKKFDHKKLRSTVGMVFQYPEYQLFDETVEKDVAFGAKNIGVPAEKLEKRVKAAIELVGLNYDEVKDRSPFELSGGQKRRVALAGVLVMKPQILVLDEPTAGLDPKGKKEILDLIQVIKSTTCPTIIMISHNMDEIAAYCDRIAVMNKGELVCVLPPNELFSKAGLIKELGLELPIITQLAISLKERGMNIPDNIIREEDLVSAILNAKGVTNA